MGLFALLRNKGRDAEPAIQERVRDEVEQGRRLAIYDQSTGLLSPWYFELRLLEESRRCQRYGLSMVIITIEAFAGDAAEASEWWTASISPDIHSAIGSVRSTDFTAALGPAKFGFCLIHCNRAGAAEFLRRFTAVSEGVNWRIGMAVYPDDDCEGKELLALAQRRSAPWKSSGRNSSAA